MKMHLPKMLTVALLAALVSFTQASGTDLTDAKLSLGDFSQEALTAANEDGWSFTNITSSADGTYVSVAGSQGKITHTGDDWAEFVSGKTNRIQWSAIVQVDVSTWSTKGSGIILQENGLGGVGYSGGKETGAWVGEAWTDLTLNSKTLSECMDGNGVVTLGVVTMGGEGTTIYLVDGQKNVYSETSDRLKGTATSGNPAMLLSGTGGVEYESLYLFKGIVSGTDMGTMMKSLVTSTAPSTATDYVWTGGVDTAWDTTTANWVTRQAPSDPVAFASGWDNTVTFGSNASVERVELKTQAQVKSVTVEGAYELQADSNGSLSSTKLVIADGGSLAVTGSDAEAGGVTVGTLSGAGDLIAGANGTVTVNGQESFSGSISVQGGTLAAGSATAFGSGAIQITGGTLDLGGYSMTLKKALNVAEGADVTIRNGKLELDTPFKVTGGSLVAESLRLDSENLDFENAQSLSFSNTDSGAISVDDNQLKLVNNGQVVFTGNKAPGNVGGAISGYGGAEVVLEGNEDIQFIGNSARSGGAIRPGGSGLYIVNNGQVLFQGNTANSYDYGGGAIQASRAINLEGNENLRFIENSTYCVGGAISSYHTYPAQDVNLVRNGYVEFKGNSANSYGGAIAASVLNLSCNENVQFIENSGSGGGAIAGSGLNLSCNENLQFMENSGSNDGGAIRVSGTLTLTNNGQVEFKGNNASRFGGAIHAYDVNAVLNLTGNGSVEFRGNYEHGQSDYRLRSVYMQGSNLTLAAGDEQDIVFYDTLYAMRSSGTMTVSFNADYMDQDGVQQKATGDIVFSGKHAAEDLAALKPNYTQQELTNSLTTEVYTTTNLYGGRLRIEDGAVYKGNGIDAVEGSGATLRLAGGTLDQTGYAIALRSGTALEIAGTDNSVSAATLSLSAGSELVLEAGASATINGTLQLAAQGSVPGAVSGGVEIAADSVSGTDGKGTMERVSMGTLADFTIENMSISGSLIDVGEGTTLYLVNVDIQPDSRITDDAAWLDMTATNAWLTKDNTVATGRRTLETDTTLYASGDTAATITLAAGSEIVELTSDMFDTVTLTGTDLWLDMTAIAGTVASAEYASLDFRSLTRALSNAMVDVDNLKVYATTDGMTYKQAYAMTDHGTTTTLYFAGMVPEPATGTLSLLALAALAARRRKR